MSNFELPADQLKAIENALEYALDMDFDSQGDDPEVYRRALKTIRTRQKEEDEWKNAPRCPTCGRRAREWPYWRREDGALVGFDPIGPSECRDEFHANALDYLEETR